MQQNPSYRQAVRQLAAAFCAGARAFTQRNGAAAAPPLGVSPAEMEDFFLTLTEQALESVPEDVLIAIVAGRMRGKLERQGFDMNSILPQTEDGARQGSLTHLRRA